MKVEITVIGFAPDIDDGINQKGELNRSENDCPIDLLYGDVRFTCHV